MAKIGKNWQKLAKIGKNWDHNIDLCASRIKQIFVGAQSSRR
jgi:hypothetical protein